MKKYNFLVRKTEEMEIEVYAQNHSIAMIELLLKAVGDDEKFFNDDKKRKKDLYVKIEKITDEKGRENLKDYENFIEENKIFISKIDDEILDKDDENIEEIEDDFPREFGEIVCENCR